MTVDHKWLSVNFPELSEILPLGQGGQKLVFGATHLKDGPVVLKLIHPRTDVEAVRREILAVQQVQSLRVPKILEHGQVVTPLGPCIWLREEQINGETLRCALKSGPLHPLRVLQLGLHILEALVRAEEVKIVHRDVKPDNIMCDTRGNFWLLDFGIARHLQLDSLTATGLRFGKMTIGYAPPEQCRNIKTEIDARADLFALGITLYESTIGVNPFCQPPPRDQLELLGRVEKWILKPLELNISDKAGFRDLVSAMTQKRRDHRPRTVKQVMEWMAEICSKEGVTS